MKDHSGAIQTKFHGITYKSREEARWAVFFESLGIDCKYEPEGFEFEFRGIRYLPDFYYSEQDCFIEIKKDWVDDDALEKATILSNWTQRKVFLFYKIPNPWASEGITESDGALAWDPCNRPGEGYDVGYYWTECLKGCTLAYGVTKGGRADLLPCNCFYEWYHSLVNLTHRIFTSEELRLLWQWAAYRFDTDWLRKAYDNARAASFDPNGNAWSGRNIPIKFWGQGRPPQPDSLPLLHLVHDIHEESSRDELRKEELQAELAKYGFGRIDWRKVRVINRILEAHDIDLDNL
jgi:hypothetical protein